MKTYQVGNITIRTSADVVGVQMGDQPQAVNVKKRGFLEIGRDVTREYWQNSYFCRHSKRYLAIKGAEVASRCLGLHTVYLVAREQLAPHIPAIIAFLRGIDWPEMLLRMDLGFFLGILTTAGLLTIKRQASGWLKGRERV